MTTDDKNKKPLVLNDAANQDEQQDWRGNTTDGSQVGAGWAGNQAEQSTGYVRDPNEKDATLNEHQLRNIEKAPDGVSVKDINKAPGSGQELKVSPSSLKYGLLQGAPSQVVIQHMLDQLPPMETKEQREKREKRERINKTIAALGDGISAIANIYYAGKGSPVAKGKSLSSAETERVERAKKERESAIDRRIRLLKEQRADMNYLQRMKMASELNEAKKSWYETQGKAKLQDAER